MKALMKLSLAVVLLLGHFSYTGMAQIGIPNDEAYVVRWSPGGNLIAILGRSSVWLYNPDLNIFSELNIESDDEPSLVAWSSNGQFLAVSNTRLSGGSSIYIWNSSTLVRTIALYQPTVGIVALAWHPDGSELATTWADGIAIWNTSDGEMLDFVEGHEEGYSTDAISWSPDGTKIVTSSDDETARIWSAGTTYQVAETVLLPEAGTNVEWSPTGTRFAVTLDSQVMIWQQTASEYELVTTLTAHNDLVLHLDWHGNFLATAGRENFITIWNTSTWQIVETIQTGGAVRSISWKPDGTQIAYTSRGSSELQFASVSNVSACSPTQTIAAGDVAGLITAINTANANPDADVIGLSAGTYTFTSIHNNRNALSRITTDITICSTDGATLTRSPSAPQFRFFEVRSTGKLTLENLTFTNGSLGVDYDGGAIYNLGTLTINNVTFSTNQAGVGGAIASEAGQVTVTDSTFTNNASTGDGGAIHSEADLLIETSTFTGNSADDAGAVNNDGGTLTVTDSTFTDNSADDGGAIYNDAGTLTLSGSTFTDNTGDAGGALDNLDGQAQIDSSTFTGNSASDGGAIRNYGGTITLTTSRFTGNMATDDGGALNNSGGILTITDTRLENNTATTRGGAIYSNSSGTMSAHNSCISGNSATAVYAASTGLQDFTGNWWGAANGPGGAGPGSGDTVNSKINHANFLTAGCPLP